MASMATRTMPRTAATPKTTTALAGARSSEAATATVPTDRNAMSAPERIVHLGSGAVIVPRLPAAARNAKVVRWIVLFGMLLIAIRCILDPAVTLAGGAQR